MNEVVDDRTLTRRLEKRVKELEKQLAQKTTLVGLMCQEGVEVIRTNDAAYFIEQTFFQTYYYILNQIWLDYKHVKYAEMSSRNG